MEVTDVSGWGWCIPLANPRHHLCDNTSHSHFLFTRLTDKHKARHALQKLQLNKSTFSGERKKIPNQFLWIVLHNSWKSASLFTRLWQPDYFCLMFRDRRTSLHVQNTRPAWDSRTCDIYVMNSSPQHFTQRG